jgi:hypothetical protein
MTSQDNTSLAALIVALLAFVIAIGQLLQQIFGTADGYRRCQSSVIGQWATKTRLSWRWAEFRFETKFTTPTIKLLPTKKDHQLRTRIKDGTGREYVSLTGFQESRVASLTPLASLDDDTDISGWVLLLDQIQALQWHINTLPIPKAAPAVSLLGHREAGEHPQRRIPAILFRERSWDLMPPELTKPLASTTVGDLIVIAHRLGMQWHDIRPSRGTMRADGNGHSLSSMPVRGYGLVVQYSNDPSVASDRDRWKNIMIPSREADKLACGIIPGCQALLVPDLPVAFNGLSAAQSLGSALDELRVTPQAKGWLTSVMAEHEQFPGFADVPGMIAPFMPLTGSSIVRVVPPLRFRPATPCTWREGRIVLRHRLKQYVNSLPEEEKSIQIVNLLEDWDFLFRKRSMEMVFNMGPAWLAANEPSDHTDDFLNDLRERFDRATKFLKGLTSEPAEKMSSYNYPTIFRYRDLVAIHVSVNYKSTMEARDKIRNGTQRNPDDTEHMSHPMSDWMHETAHVYADKVPEIVEHMSERFSSDARLIIDSWWTMIFRAILWELSVVYLNPDAFPRVASEFYGSRTPVYIA